MMNILSTRQSYLFLSFTFLLPTKILAYNGQWIGIPGEENEYWLWENSNFLWFQPSRRSRMELKNKDKHMKSFYFKKKYKKINNITWKTVIIFFKTGGQKELWILTRMRLWTCSSSWSLNNTLYQFKNVSDTAFIAP